MFFGHMGGRFLAYFCHGDAFWAQAKCRFLRQNFDILVPLTDLEDAKYHVQEFFWDTAAQPQASAHIKAQTDGRISQTIFGIQSKEAKRDDFPGFSAYQFWCLDAPATIT